MTQHYPSQQQQWQHVQQLQFPSGQREAGQQPAVQPLLKSNASQSGLCMARLPEIRIALAYTFRSPFSSCSRPDVKHVVVGLCARRVALRQLPSLLRLSFPPLLFLISSHGLGMLWEVLVRKLTPHFACPSKFAF